MADGDKAVSSISKGLFDRDLSERVSYFFDEQVKLCQSEQYKVLGSELAKKEEEAQITYERLFSAQIGTKAQIDTVFVQLMFDSDASVNLDKLIDDLRMLAHKKSSGKDVTRLLDLLYVSRMSATLTEEMKIRNAPYDFNDPEANGRFGPMATFYKLSSDYVGNFPHRSNELALMFAMLATGQEDVVATALVHMANALQLPWDALVLSRYLFGTNNEVTRLVTGIWKKAVMKDDQLRMIKIALSLSNSNLKDVAHNLAESASDNQTDSTDQFNAYRCLTIALHNASKLPEVERNLEVAEISRLMREIYTWILGKGKLNSARQMLGDLSNRATPGGIPSYICQIGLNCHIELVELFLRPPGVDAPAPAEGIFKPLAKRWRTEINRKHAEMSKLKADTPGLQKVVDDWIVQLVAVMKAPLVETTTLSKEMDYVFVAFEFLPELLRWASTGQAMEPLRLVWPNNIACTITDESIVILDYAAGTRSRTISVGSSRSAVTAKDDGKKQKNKGDAKEERPHDMSSASRGNQLHNEHSVHSGQDTRDVRSMQSQKSASQRPNSSFNGASGDHGNQQKRGDRKTHSQSPAPSQDVRRTNTASGHEHNDTNLPLPVANLMASAASGGPLIPGSPGGNSLCAYSPGVGQEEFTFRRTSSSSSAHDLAKIDQPSSLLSISNPVMVDQSKASAPSTVTPLTTIEQQESQKAASTQSNPSPLKSPPIRSPEPTQKDIQFALEESMKKRAAGSETREGEKPIREEQTSASLSSQHPIAQKPTMGTAAANEARARRIVESVQHVELATEPEVQHLQQPSESEPQSMQQPDQHFQELTKQFESKGDDDDRQIAPDPAEMNKLFTGTSKGQATLPPGLLAETEKETTSGEAPSSRTIMQPLPFVPTLMAAAESGTSSLNLTQLTPSDTFVLPPPASESTHRTYASSSTESMLTPITEASQETTKSTVLSESDAPGLANESTDTVFEEEATEANQALHVNVHHTYQMASDQSTPKECDLLSNYSFGTQSRSGSGEKQQRKDTPVPSPLAASPHLSSPMHTETSAPTDSSEMTTMEPITSQTMEVRTEAEDTNQQHQPLAAVPVEVVQPLQPDVAATVESMGHQSDVAFVTTSTTEIQLPPQVGHESTQTHDFSIEMAAASVAPTGEPVNLQQQACPQQMMPPPVPAVNADASAQSLPLTSGFASVEVQPNGHTQQHQPEYQKVTTMVSTDQQLGVDCAESDVKELVTSCGISYKYSPTKVETETTESKEELLGGDQGELDSFLSMMDGSAGTGGGAEVSQSLSQNAISMDQNASTSNSIWNTPSYEAAGSMANYMNDEHATHLHVETSERPDSELRSASLYTETYGSVPSTALTTPEPTHGEAAYLSSVRHPDAGYGGEVAEMGAQMSWSDDSNVGGYSEQQNTYHQPPQQHQSGDFVTQMSLSSLSNSGDSEQQQQPTFQQMHQPLQSGDLQQESTLPLYVDPFDQQQQQQSQSHQVSQQEVHQPPVNPNGAPGFGTWNRGQSVQQQSQQGGTQHQGSGYGRPSNQNTGNQNPGFTQFNNSHGSRSGRGGRGGRTGGGQRGRGFGGTGGGSQNGSSGFGGTGVARYGGSGFGGGDGGQGGSFSGFGGSQENRGGNGQQQPQRGGGSGLGGGDNGQQKVNFGTQDVRRAGGRGTRGFPS